MTMTKEQKLVYFLTRCYFYDDESKQICAVNVENSDELEIVCKTEGINQKFFNKIMSFGMLFQNLHFNIQTLETVLKLLPEEIENEPARQILIALLNTLRVVDSVAMDGVHIVAEKIRTADEVLH